MPPRFPAWFQALPLTVRVLLGGVVFTASYWLWNQISFSHWGVAAWIPFIAFWLLPYRYWPVIVAGEIATSLLTNILVGKVTGDIHDGFLGYWPGPVQFVLGTFVNPITNMIGPWLMLRAGFRPWQRVTPGALAWLHVAALAQFVPPVIKDIFYVLYEGRVGDVRHNVRGNFVALSGFDDWRMLGEFALSHLLGGFLGIMITVPLCMWWLGRRAYRDNRRVLTAGLNWLVPLVLMYVMLAWVARGSALSELLRLLLMSAVIVYSMRFGWRGAALSVFATSLAMAIEDHLGIVTHSVVWLQTFIAIVGAVALLFGAALDALREGNAKLRRAQLESTRLQNRLQAAATRNVEAEERERKRLAADLHDEFGQTLVALQSQLTQAMPVLRMHGPADLPSALQDSSALLRRHIVTTLDHLRPASLDALGLFGALDRGAIRHLAERAGLQYNVDLCGDARLLSELGDATRMAAYRIVQGAVANIVRHARAEHAWVRLRVELRHDEIWLMVTVDDDGQGRVEALRRHHGLIGMQDRILALGGVLRLRNRMPGLRLHALLRQPMTR